MGPYWAEGFERVANGPAYTRIKSAPDIVGSAVKKPRGNWARRRNRSGLAQFEIGAMRLRLSVSAARWDHHNNLVENIRRQTSAGQCRLDLFLHELRKLL